jgi:hypothetical protein
MSGDDVPELVVMSEPEALETVTIALSRYTTASQAYRDALREYLWAMDVYRLSTGISPQLQLPPQ